MIAIVLVLFVAGGIWWTKRTKRTLPAEATAAGAENVLDRTNQRQLDATRNLSPEERDRIRNTPPRREQSVRRSDGTTGVVPSERVKEKQAAYAERQKKREEAEQRVREWQQNRSANQ